MSDRVKQALFGLLEATRDDVWDHALLDLYAGSGAAGIEALSRGAPRALLVERDRRATAVIHRNLEHTGLAGRARVVARDVAGFLASAAAETPEAPFGSVVIDPPYEHVGELLDSLDRLGAEGSGWIDGSAVVVAKHFWRAALPDRAGDLERTRGRRFGETALSVYRRRPDTPAGAS
jgi:16S rRNA (guanine966-N2)-methyltransferase